MPTKKLRFAWKRVTHVDKSCYIEDPNYCLHYPKGSIVKAPKGSYGISVFKDWSSANEFCLGKKIKKVRIIGKIRKNPLIRTDDPYGIKAFYKIFKGFKNLRYADYRWARLYDQKIYTHTISNSFPQGTLWVDGVEVLD